MPNDENEIELMDYLNVIWKRKWLIILPTFFCLIAADIISFLLPPKWEVNAIIQPSKFFTQTEQGQFEKVVVVDPKQIAGQINEASYNHLIAAELNLDIRGFPKLRTENLRDTKLVRISIREQDVEKAKLILTSLFNHLKRELDKKIDVGIKGINTKIATNENLIKHKNLTIKDKMSEIKLNEIEKNKIKQEILSAENKLKLSQEREKSIIEEMKAVKTRLISFVVFGSVARETHPT